LNARGGIQRIEAKWLRHGKWQFFAAEIAVVSRRYHGGRAVLSQGFIRIYFTLPLGLGVYTSLQARRVDTTFAGAVKPRIVSFLKKISDRRRGGFAATSPVRQDRLVYRWLTPTAKAVSALRACIHSGS